MLEDLFCEQHTIAPLPTLFPYLCRVTLAAKVSVFQRSSIFIFEVIMSVSIISSFENFLDQHTDEAWSQVIIELLPSIHEVDRTATHIWFHFYPLALLRALQQAEDPEKLAAQLLLQGDYYLKDQIDSSHTFLYGHRFWPEVKRAVIERAETFAEPNADLTSEIREIAKRAASTTKAQE